ncbi:MAG: ASKHA domain-containing protein [Candidatus Muirbacterium halophilum]|nr:ASKHA domain-containing protein [Candidatus Muirbacterium halophilum]MCK9474955.1 ASKHA domain-containing protein [Candidatus Muirbacterium halophilum]
MLLIDIGTSFVKSFNTLNSQTFKTENFQGEFGIDIISRIDYSLKSKENYQKIREKLIYTIKKHLIYNNIEFNYVNNEFKNLNTNVFLIGNSVMQGFYDGISLKNMARKPFRLPKYNKNINSENIEFFPCIGGFAGSDIYPLIWKLKNSPEKIALGMDFGTNCEILLKIEDKIFVSSAPAGPAFENISFLADNIIIDVKFDGVLQFFLKENSKKADFITPHAFIKLISLLLKRKMISKNGRINNNIVKNNVNIDTNKIRELLKAKAAVSSTVEILKKYYAKGKNIEKIYISGNMINSDTVEYMKNLGIIEDLEVFICKELFYSFAYYSNKYINNKKKLIKSIKDKVFYFPHYNLSDYDEIFINELYFGEKI